MKLKLIENFNFEKFRTSIWPTLWVVFFIFCLVIWGLHLGKRAGDLTHPVTFAGFIEKLVPWIIAVAIFFNPKLGLVFLVFAISLSPVETLGKIQANRRIELRLEDYLIPFLYFIWLSRMWLKGKMRFIKVPITSPIVALTLTLAFSSIFGVLVNWAEGPPAFFYWLKLVEYYALFFLIVNLVETEKERQLIIYALIFVSVIVSVWAIFQGVTGFVISTGRAGGRAAMPFDTEPATLGEYYVLLIPIILLTLFPRKNFFPLFFNGLIVLMAFLGLLFSLSRGAQMGLFVALPLISFFYIKETRPAIIISVIMLALYAFFADQVLNLTKLFSQISLTTQITIISLFFISIILGFIFIKRHRLLVAVLAISIIIFSLNPKFITRLGTVTGELASAGGGGTVATYGEKGRVIQITRTSEEAGISAEEVQYRSWSNRISDLWPQVLDKISESPIFGRGLSSIRVADNYFLRITAEAGVIGLFCFLWLISRIYRNIFNGIKIAPAGSTLGILSRAVLIILTGILITAISDDSFLPVRVMEPFWLIMGLFYSAWLRFNPEKAGRPD